MTEEIKQKIGKYRACFGTPEGKFVLDDLDKNCLYRRDLFDVGSERLTSFNLGKNAVVRYIHEWIEKIVEEPKPETARHETVI